MSRYLVVLCVLLLTGCASSERESTAGQAAERFLDAVASGDLSTACALLSPKTRDDLLIDAASCTEALGSQSLPTSPVNQTSVWGDRAQSRTDAGALFLAEFEDGWRVVAAGCQPREQLPYRCVVGG